MLGGFTALDQTVFGEDESKRYIVGAAFEYRLWRGLSVEANFLYRRNGFRWSIPGNLEGGRYPGNIRVRDHVFELPVLGKYYFRREAGTQPYVLTGYSFRKAYSSTVNEYPLGISPGGGSQRFETSHWSRGLDVGAAIGGGLQWKAGRVRFTPEVRYTRWGGGPAVSAANNNQLDVLFGIRF